MNQKTKIAVLGGGAGSLAAAFALTSTPELRERYEVTVFQLCKRLGGNGRSGRNAAWGQRIEEHGLHLWMGWYHNAFRLIRDCYEEWQPADGCPFASWTDAFAPQNHIALMEWVEDRWLPWEIDLPPNPDLPGEGGMVDSVCDYLVALINWVRSRHNQLAA